MYSKVIGLYILMLLVPAWMLAQRVITGVVKDNDGPLNNASVVEKGLVSNGTATNTDGKFRLTIKGSSNTIVVSIVGYAQQEVNVRTNSTPEVILQKTNQGLNDVVVVGFEKKDRITNTGSVSTIKAEQIRTVPTSAVQNALSGRVPGFFSVQRSGQPGRDASDFFIRGQSSLNPAGNQPLIIVDDIEYSYTQLAQINVNEIESISILKDAATTAIYGIKGANGVLVVTTRRGVVGKPRINVRTEAGFQTPSKRPRILDAYNSVVLLNEARVNDGLAPRFDSTAVEHFRKGDSYYDYPNVSWYDSIFKKASWQTNTNIDISGGTQAVKYFMSFGTFFQNGSIKDFSSGQDGLNTNYYYNRYNFRTNLDIQATRALTLRLDVTGRFGQINQPNTDNIIGEIYNFTKITPYAAPFLNPNGSYSFANYPESPDKLPTLNARLALSGYTRNNQNDLNILFSGTEKLDAILKGLAFSGRIAYASTWNVGRQLFRDLPPSYHYIDSTKTYVIDPRGRYNLPTYGLRASNPNADRRVNIQGLLTYNKNITADHHINSLLLYNQVSYQINNGVPENSTGFSFKTDYDFRRKYLVGFVVGYNGSDRFTSAKRYGLFPAVSAGWNISEEPFFKNTFPSIKLLKFKGSYGIVGSDLVVGNRYAYDQVYNRTGGYSFGTSPGGTIGIQEGNLGNNNITWEKERKINLALEGSLWNDKVNFVVEHFMNRRYDQLISRGSVPLILGVGTAPDNYGVVVNKGWDGQLTYQDKLGAVNFTITATLSFAKNRIVYQDEALQRYPWLSRTGYPIGQPFGYTFIGFYQSQDDITKSAKPNIQGIKPGDLKYKDLNGDGIIDENDQSAIGRPNLPNTNAGLLLGANYKGFSASVLFQGATGYSFSVRGAGIEPLQSQFQPVHLERWTTTNNVNPAFPRLTTNPSSVSSPTAYPSDFWLVNASYIRFKTVELAYQLPDRWLPLKISNARFYVSGYNLLTFTNFSLYQQDPEVSSASVGDAYLNQRVINFGVQVGL